MVRLRQRSQQEGVAIAELVRRAVESFLHGRTQPIIPCLPRLQ
ncbi:hypothetical protein [Ktedonosporobacter rubrisoli]|nr:hypothetical protein [Ktedonosporobacter rubrisoli]